MRKASLSSSPPLLYVGLALHQSLIISPDFQHILRILNTNVDGTKSVQYALCSIKGIGRRFSNVVCKKAEIDCTRR